MWSRVDVPVPDAPGSDEVVDKGGELGNWIAGQGSAFMIIVICLIGALIVMSMLKRPFVRGLVVGAIILAVLVASGVFGGGR